MIDDQILHFFAIPSSLCLASLQTCSGVELTLHRSRTARQSQNFCDSLLDSHHERPVRVSGWEPGQHGGVCYELLNDKSDTGIEHSTRLCTDRETNNSQTKIVREEGGRRTKLSVLKTLVFESTTAVAADVPICADPTQWLESIVERS